jgi:hypothetical protein
MAELLIGSFPSERMWIGTSIPVKMYIGRNRCPSYNAKLESCIKTLEGRGRLRDGLRNLRGCHRRPSPFIDDVYNTQRFRSALGCLSPAQREDHRCLADSQNHRVILSSSSSLSDLPVCDGIDYHCGIDSLNAGMGLLVYGYTTGVFSRRKLERAVPKGRR